MCGRDCNLQEYKSMFNVSYHLASSYVDESGVGIRNDAKLSPNIKPGIKFGNRDYPTKKIQIPSFDI